MPRFAQSRSNGWRPDGLSFGLCFISTAKRSVNSAAIVGENGVNGMREVGKEALEEPGRGVGVPLGMDLQIDVAGGAIDGDEGVAFAPLQRWQVLEVDMDEADGGLLEDAD